MSDSSAYLSLEALSVSYPGKLVVRQLDMSLSEGEIGCLLGPSGCGKTTALRAIAGFERPARGAIRLDGLALAGGPRFVEPEKRRIGMVFQDFALFPHLDVVSNVTFGLRHLAAGKRRKRANELLELVGLSDRGGCYPHQLSGGQQQRVALARALAPRPQLLLMDEPFSSLDTELRTQLAAEVRDILKREQITALLVTHDQQEAFAVADQIGVMNEGQLDQWADGHTLYHQPATRFVADFVGEGVLIRGQSNGEGCVETGVGPVRTEHRQQGPVQVLLRPDDLRLGEAGSIRGVVVGRDFRGAEYLYRVELGNGEKVLALMPSHFRLDVGAECGVHFAGECMPVFPMAT